MSVNMMGISKRKTRLSTSFRLDGQHSSTESGVEPAWSWNLPARFAALAAMATVFVFLYAASLDLGPEEARLGLAAGERLAPVGQVFGGWEPSILPGQLAPSLVWAWGEGGTPTSDSIRWPAAIAGVILGLFLTRGAATWVSGRAGVITGLCWYGCFGLIDHSSTTGLDLLTGLATVATLSRLLGPGADSAAGVWAALAFLCGGWPPLAVIALTTVVLGRHGATLNARLVLPPLATAVAWSVWTLKTAPAEVWGAALFRPLTEHPAWLFIPGVIALGLPFAPLAGLVGWRSIRDGWSREGRSFVMGWLQIVGVCALAGTVVPGLASAARTPALAGLAVAAGAACDRLLATPEGVGRNARRWFFGVMLANVIAWTAAVVPVGGYLAAAVSYYRVFAVTMILMTIPVAALAIFAASRRTPRLALGLLATVAVFLKMAHAGYYVPEWNYRASQGPWGRAVGQWVPPHWPIYTTHSWAADLAFATEHPVRQLVSPWHLSYQPGEAKHVLLLESEFVHWPEQAPKLIEVARFQDEFDQTRVLARTPGDLPWTRPAKDDDE